jgi:hypothetical protein
MNYMLFSGINSYISVFTFSHFILKSKGLEVWLKQWNTCLASLRLWVQTPIQNKKKKKKRRNIDKGYLVNTFNNLTVGFIFETSLLDINEKKNKNGTL